MTLYLVERVYHTHDRVFRVPCGTCPDRPSAKSWQRRMRRAHRDVAGGLCNVAVRRVPS